MTKDELSVIANYVFPNQQYYDMRYFFSETLKIPKQQLPNAIWMNYLPYISNCGGLGAHLDLEDMMNLDKPDFSK